MSPLSHGEMVQMARMHGNSCVICGEEIPEGRMVCPNCEKQKPMKNLSHGEMVQIAEGRKKKMPKIYIDAEYLLKELSFYADRPTKSAMDTIKGLAMRPDPDVVKVVRCRDCEYWDPGSPMATVIPTPCRCRVRREDYGMTAEDFCSYGRRKEKTNAEIY